MALTSFEISNLGTVHQENVHPSVIVVVQRGDTATHGIHNVQLFGSPTGEPEINSCRKRYVCKRDTGSGRSLVRGWLSRGRFMGRRRALGKGFIRQPDQDGCDPGEQQHPREIPTFRHHWIGPAAIPPVTGCALFKVVKVSSSCLASSLLPSLSRARDN